jgi:hypothetical protein
LDPLDSDLPSPGSVTMPSTTLDVTCVILRAAESICHALFDSGDTGGGITVPIRFDHPDTRPKERSRIYCGGRPWDHQPVPNVMNDVCLGVECRSSRQVPRCRTAQHANTVLDTFRSVGGASLHRAGSVIVFILCAGRASWSQNPFLEFHPMNRLSVPCITEFRMLTIDPSLATRLMRATQPVRFQIPRLPVGGLDRSPSRSSSGHQCKPPPTSPPSRTP